MVMNVLRDRYDEMAKTTLENNIVSIRLTLVGGFVIGGLEKCVNDSTDLCRIEVVGSCRYEELAYALSKS